MAAAGGPQRDKISAEFAARLARGPADRPCRSIVLLQTGAGSDAPKHPGRSQRKAAVAAVKESAQKALEVVDEVLERIGGRRLSAAPDALGSIRVEVTPEGIYKLAHLKEVKAVLEDQGLSPLPPPRT
jgi:hypothetical protein